MKARSYHSPARQKQADLTRKTIVDAARRLFVRRGFDGATVEAIAKEAGVSTPTVYAVFGSKAGVVKELLEQARFGPEYEQLVSAAMAAKSPVETLAYAPRISRSIYEAERAQIDLLRGAGAVSPELRALVEQKEDERYRRQGPTIEALAAGKHLRKGLSREQAADVLWTMTSRDVFQSLVVHRGWSGEQYVSWLQQTLRELLLRPKTTTYQSS